MQKQLLILSLLLTLPLSAREWRAKNEPAPVAQEVKMTEAHFASLLSDYHRSRFMKFSPSQKRRAMAYNQVKSMTADSAVDQVALDEILKR